MFSSSESFRRFFTISTAASFLLTACGYGSQFQGSEGLPTPTPTPDSCTSPDFSAITNSWHQDISSGDIHISLIAQTEQAVPNCRQLIVSRIFDSTGRIVAASIRLEDNIPESMATLKDILFSNNLGLTFSSEPGQPVGPAPVDITNQLLDLQDKGIPVLGDVGENPGEDVRKMKLMPLDGTEIIVPLDPTNPETVNFGPNLGSMPLSEFTDHVVTWLSRNLSEKTSVATITIDSPLITSNTTKLEIRSLVSRPTATPEPFVQSTLPVATIASPPSQDFYGQDNPTLPHEILTPKEFVVPTTAAVTIKTGDTPFEFYTFVNKNGNGNQIAMEKIGRTPDHKYADIKSCIEDPNCTADQILDAIEKSMNEAKKAESWWFNTINRWKQDWNKIFPEAKRTIIQNDSVTFDKILRTFDLGKTILTIAEQKGEMVFYTTTRSNIDIQTFVAKSETGANHSASKNLFQLFKWGVENELDINKRRSQGFFVIPGGFQSAFNVDADQANTLLDQIYSKEQNVGVFIVLPNGDLKPASIPTGSFVTNTSNQSTTKNLEVISIDGSTYIQGVVNIQIPNPRITQADQASFDLKIIELFGTNRPTSILVAVPLSSVGFIEHSTQFKENQAPLPTPTRVFNPNSYLLQPPARSWLGSNNYLNQVLGHQMITLSGKDQQKLNKETLSKFQDTFNHRAKKMRKQAPYYG